jgi:predicted DsbA family dithiol-disulfide isomerase
VLEEAARRFGARVSVRWHAYELRPDPAPLPDPSGAYLREHWETRVAPMAAGRGLAMTQPRRSIRSRRALQAALYAREHGRFRELDRLLFRARFEQDADISDLDVLSQLAQFAGLDGEAAAYAVAQNAYLGPLRDDVALAGRLGVSGVPAAFVGPETSDLRDFFAEAEQVSGAVPYEWLGAALERALDREPAPVRLIRR